MARDPTSLSPPGPPAEPDAAIEWLYQHLADDLSREFINGTLEAFH